MRADVIPIPAMHTRAPRIRQSLATAAILALVGVFGPRDANADVFGRCAHQRDIESKIARCTEASKSTSFAKALHWVYRELARAHYERGEMEKAITGYVQSLTAEERAAVRREMQALLDLM